MCLRVSQYSEETFGVAISVSNFSEENFLDVSEVILQNFSEETFTREVFLSNFSTEVFLTEEERDIVDPETETPFDPPDPDNDYIEDILDPDTGLPTNTGWPPLKVRDSSVKSDAYWIPAPELTASIAGIDLTPYMLGFNVSENRGGPCSGSITCRDRSGFLAGALSTLNMDNSSLCAHNMSYDRVVELSFKQRSNKTAYPTFIPTDPVWDTNEIVTINFTDGNALLNLDNQSIPDVVDSEGLGNTSNNVMSQLATLAGVGLVSSIPDYAIRTFRFSSGNVGNGIDELSKTMQGYRIFRGTTCYIESLEEKSPTWKFKDRFHIEELSGGFETNGLRTFFTALLTEDQASYLADPLSCVGGQCVGRVVNLSFQFPTSFAKVYWQGSNGVIEDGVFWSEEGPVGQGEFYSGSIDNKAVRWEATFVPRFSSSANGPTAQAYVPAWTVWAIGGHIPSGLPRSEFIRSLASATAEAKFGRRPEVNNLTSELIRNTSTLELMLEKIVEEVNWSMKKYSLKTPFVQPVRAGDFVSVEDERLSVNRDLLVEGWSHSWSTESGFSCTMELAGTL